MNLPEPNTVGMLNGQTANCKRVDVGALSARSLEIFSPGELAQRLTQMRLNEWKTANQKKWRRRWWKDRTRCPKHYRSAGTKAGGEPRIPFAALAAFAGVSRQTVYMAARGEMSERNRIWLSNLLQRLDAGDCHFERQGQQWMLVDGPSPQPSVEAILRERERERQKSERLSPPQSAPVILPYREVVARLAAVERGTWFGFRDLADRAGLPCPLVIHARRGVMTANVQTSLSAALLALQGDKP